MAAKPPAHAARRSFSRKIEAILNMSEQSKPNATGVRPVQGSDTANEPEEEEELVDIPNFIVDDDDE
jgi:hypothetical protein